MRDGAYHIVVVPLLVESGNWASRVERVLVVDCPVETQIARVMRRNGFSREQVLAIIAHQATREARLAAADDIVVNDEHATLDTLAAASRCIARALSVARQRREQRSLRKVHTYQNADWKLPRTATKMRCGKLIWRRFARVVLRH